MSQTPPLSRLRARIGARSRLRRARRRVAARLAPYRWRGSSTREFRRFIPGDVEAAALEAAVDTDLERQFYRRVHLPGARPLLKWQHYLAVYDQYLAPWRGRDVGLLEIGVFQGGSLDLWRDHLGAEARIVGVDIDPDCAARVTPPNQVRIGSQDDPVFLREVVADLGRLDLVIDDGSHVGAHQRVSFETLFPLLEPGGLYIIEDLHTAYWYDHEGGVQRPGTGIELVKEIIDDMHGWYHPRADRTGAKEWIPALHVYDSLVVIEKRRRTIPRVIGNA